MSKIKFKGWRESNIELIYKKLKKIKKINDSIGECNKIIFNGKEYPFTQWNLDRIWIYGETKDEKYLDEMKDFCLE